MLLLQTFAALMQTMAASVQGAASQLIDLSVGSVLRAILEANAAVALWVQWLIVQVLGVTRAATSAGSDLDSWMADYSLTRLPATPAVGAVTLARYTTTLTAFIPVGTQVRSADGSQSFSVTADPTNAAFSATLNGYTLGAGVASLIVPLVASNLGAAGNLQPGTATVLGSAIAGVDTVINALPFAGGADAETDPAFRARFSGYIQSLSLATPLALATALQGVQQGLSYAIAENTAAGGATQPGSFLVTLDDGSGNPPASLLSAATAAVEAVRPIGSVFAVLPPTIFRAGITMTIAVANAATLPAAIAAVTAALTAALNALPIGAPLPWSRLAQIAYDASPLITNVTGVTLNGSTADLVIPGYGVIKAGTLGIA
jgi:uncharacterized phage protein gp47/JayE